MKNRTFFAIIIAIACIVNCNERSQAQVSTLYSFNQAMGSYTALASSTDIFTGTWDDAVSSPIPIPFVFYFNCTGYTSCEVSTNGFITFGTGSALGSEYTPISGTASYDGAVAAIGRDLVYGLGTTSIVYGLEGTAPNRVFVIQWNNAYRYNGGRRASNFNFQIRLRETTNIIQIAYGSCVSSYATDLPCEVGLRGASNADFNNRTTSNNWPASTAGAVNTATCNSGNGAGEVPPTGLIYTWTPAAPSILVQPSSIYMCAGQTVDFTISTIGTGYQWLYAGAPVVNGTPAGAVYSNATSSTLSVSGAIAPGVYSPYSCAVTDGCGGTFSASANLNVVGSAPPATPPNPTESTVLCNDVLTRTGAPPGGQTWYWQGQTCGNNMLLGSGATYTATSNGTYYIRARDNTTSCWSNSCGNVSVIIDAPSIVVQPQNTSACVGIPVTFSISSTGAGISFQWQENGINLSDVGVYSGTTTQTLTISNPAGLNGRTYRCIVSGSCVPSATSVSATLTVLGSALSGVRTVGTAGNYANLRLAFNDINTNGLSGDLELQIISSITDNNEAILNESASCGTMGYNIYIYPTGAGSWTLQGTSATSLITLNGADHVTFDGRLNQAGAPNNLIISNTNVAGSTIKLQADACYNTIKYCDIMGVETSYSTGVIHFGTGTNTGNDHNLIDNCIIHDGASTPANGIFGAGTSGKENDDNTVSNCNIFNTFIGSGGFGSGIDLEDGNSRWTITGNSFYQTSPRVDCSIWFLYVRCPGGNEFTIKDNFIGGSAPNCGGAQFNSSYSGYLVSLYGISLTCSNTGISNIENNTIQNIHFTVVPYENAGIIYTRFAPISTTGRIDVVGNKIGDGGNNSIWVTMNSYLTNRGGITAIIKGGDGVVKDNEIGSFTLDGSITQQFLFNGIQITGNLINDVVISGNTLGHATTANSIQTSGANPPVTFGGIYFGTVGSYTTTVSNNLIANITLNNTTTTPFLIGLSNQASGGVQTIIGNTVRNLTTRCTNTSSGNMPALVGILNENNVTGGITVSKNQIHSLSATGTAAVFNFGIYCINATSGSNSITSNYIHSLSTSTTGSYNVGILLASGTATLSNNMVRLGIDASGASIATDAFFIGLWKASTSSSNTYHNSVYIGGNTAGLRTTYGYYRFASGVDNNRNNIYYNARTGGTAKHYAIVTVNTTTFTSNYNDLFSSNAANLGSYDGGTTARTFAAWQGGVGDAQSINQNPLFLNPTGNTTNVDLHINTLSPCIGKGIAGTGILTDFDQQQRKTGVNPNGPCMGADEVINTPLGANAYGIYSPDPLGGNVADCEIFATGGTPGGIGIELADNNDANWANVNISGYQVITASNYSCMNTNMTFTTTGPTPDWLFGNGAIPNTGFMSPIDNVRYFSTGRKSIIESFRVFKDFVNITMDVPDAGSILGAPIGAGCPTTYSYTSSEAGTAGFTYFWSCTPPGGCSANINSPTASTTDVTFVNPTGVTQVFELVLIITTECCGPLDRVVRYITIYPGPLAPTVIGSPFNLCTGGSQTVNINAPDPTYTYEWYDAGVGGTLIGTGSSFTVNPVLSGSNSYWVQAVNSYGCPGPRTEVVIIGIDTPPPTVPNTQSCGAGFVTFVVSSPTAGYTYNWYSGSCGGTLEQSSTATSFTAFISATTTYYVQAVPPACGPSNCTSITASLVAPPNPIVWLGVAGGLNNWFNTANWTSGCLPTCNTNVSIPNLAIDPDIGFDPLANAACQNINLQAGAVLSFSDNKAELDVCGDFVHAGIITTNNLGLIKFMGSIAQNYTITGSGDLHNVTLENTAPIPSLTLNSGDMTLDASGVFNFVNGKVNTGANNLSIKNTDVAAVSGHNVTNYVNGYLIRYLNATGLYDFPVGNVDAYELASLDITANTGITWLRVNFANPANAFGSGLPLIENTLSYDLVLNNGGINATTGNANGGVWTMTPNAGTANYGITLVGRNFDNFGASHTIVKRVTAGPGAWAFPGTAVSDNNVANVITCVRSGVSGFSQFAIALTDDVLPVSLLKFTANCKDFRVFLNWSTASENNNDFFTIERSENGTHWVVIGTVDGAGNSNNIRTYSFIDENPFTDNSYYRLKQTDYNGASETFQAVSVVCNGETQSPAISIYPNPFSNEVVIELMNVVSDNGSIILYNVLGEMVRRIEIGYQDGSNQKIIMNLSDLAAGIYSVEFQSTDLSTQRKVIKLK